MSDEGVKTEQSITTLELYHLLFPEGTDADFEINDVSTMLDAAHAEIEKYGRQRGFEEAKEMAAQCLAKYFAGNTLKVYADAIGKLEPKP